MPSQFDGQVLGEDGRPLPEKTKVVLSSFSLVSPLTTYTNDIGEWFITVDQEINPEFVTITFTTLGYETRVVTNPQCTEILRGFIDPEKGGILDLTGMYSEGKYDLSRDDIRELIRKEAQDTYQFTSRNYGNYIITIDATETRTEKDENTSIDLLFPGSLAEARADELKKIFEYELSNIYYKKKNGTPPVRFVNHIPKVELGNIDIVEGVKPSARIKVNYISPPIANIPIPSNEEEFIQFLTNNGFERLTTQEAIDKASVYPGNYPIKYLEYFYYDKKEERFVVKYGPISDPKYAGLKNLIKLGRFNILIQIDGSVYSSPTYDYAFDNTQAKYAESQPNLQKWINDNFINLSTKANIQRIDKELIIKTINNISSLATTPSSTSKEYLQKGIDIDMNYVKRHIENLPEIDRKELYDLLGKQRDIILANGFAVNITW